jgi:hypothetical protein
MMILLMRMTVMNDNDSKPFRPGNPYKINMHPEKTWMQKQAERKAAKIEEERKKKDNEE